MFIVVQLAFIVVQLVFIVVQLVFIVVQLVFIAFLPNIEHRQIGGLSIILSKGSI